MDKGVCDIDDAAPPERLPKYGRLREARFLKNLITCRTAISTKELLMEKKREMCRDKPMSKRCVPEQILLPSKPIPENAGRYLEAESPPDSIPGRKMRFIRVKKEPVVFPEWLIDMSDDQVKSAVDVKEVLASGKPLCELIDPLDEAVQALGGGVTREEVIEILKRMPSAGGWSFSRFMFIAASPAYARKVGLLQYPIPFEESECPPPPDEEEEEEEEKDQPPKKIKRKKLYENPRTKRPEDKWAREKTKSGDDSGEKYTARQQLLYSALLYCEMYDTMKSMETQFSSPVIVPEPLEQTIKREQALGLGASQLGTKRFGWAAWDVPLPPVPKHATPYLGDFSLVSFRKKYVTASGKGLMYKRSTTSFPPLYLAVKPPKKLPEEKGIKVVADNNRVQRILGLMGSEGNCLAKLPDVVNIFYMGDTLLQKLEEIRPPPDVMEWLPRIYWGTELLWLAQEVKFLYQPHGLPKKIAKICPLVTFPEGLKLREICSKIRAHHWEYICLRKEQFRQIAWPLMHVDRIPCGNLRENFVYAFQTYLPVISHLPIVRKNPFAW